MAGGVSLIRPFFFSRPCFSLIGAKTPVTQSIAMPQVGRRAHVRTSDGFTGWLSLQTLDQMDIAVKLEHGKVPACVGGRYLPQVDGKLN